MADFVAVLKRTIEGLGDTTPEIREKVYEKARATIGAKLAALQPAPPPAVADRQRQALEQAIREIEAGYARKPPAADPLDELDALFAELKPGKPREAGKPPHKPEAAAAKQPAPQPAPPQAARPQQPAPQPAQAARPSAAVPGKPAAPDPAPKPAQAAPAAAAPAAKPARPSPAQPSPAAAPAPKPVQPAQAAPAVAAAREAPAAPQAARQRPAAPTMPGPATDPILELDEPLPPRRPARAGMGLWLAAVGILLLACGAGYALYLNKDSFLALLGTDQPPRAASVEPAPDPEPEAAAEEEGTAAQEPAAPVVQPRSTTKFTQRLNPDGTEVDAGPAGGQTTIGEGTSLAAASQPGQPEPASPPAAPGDAAAVEEGEGDAEDGAPAPEAAVQVGQKAIFYEERTSVAEGTAETGSTLWSLVEESPGGDLPPEPVIRAVATIPAKDMQLRMTIRRNGDRTLPASHIVELIFITPDDFSGGPIDNVLRMTMKDTEQAAGNPLLGIPAKIADGFFLVALNDSEREVQMNTQLMLRQSWIDVPVVYKSGRRALITMEKGIPGEKVFDEAVKAWQAASSG